LKNQSPHSFHIPVLGLSFSVDTPAKVARYGISSVMSIMDDGLLENLRSFYCHQHKFPFHHITKKEHDSRAKRITAYLNTIKRMVDQQFDELKNLEFAEGTDLWKYFELLPQNSPLKISFESMCAEKDASVKVQMQNQLRNAISPGSIDVNIMAKVDNPTYDKNGDPMPDEFSDALSALRGYAQSDLESSIIFSAGYNPRLYSYIEQFEDFYPENNYLRKKIILKVSDYRSAMVQGKILAKKGLWVSDFRIESGLNCGGHTFATDGLLLGPILEEFRLHKKALLAELYDMCNQGLKAKGRKEFTAVPKQKVTAQGGVGNNDEHQFLLSYFELDGVGWGSPFLLVPEATNVDDRTLQLLATANKEDYYLSYASPLGVPFNNFRKSSGEEQRKQRIDKGRPGSPCYKKLLSNNTEFTEKIICTSSRQYQDLKIKQIKAQQISEEEKQQMIDNIEEKDCLCEGLTSSVLLKNKIPVPHNINAVTICPGPNLAYFSGVHSLKEMVSHIYGRINLNNKLDRPNMFINELQLYIDYLQRQISEFGDSISDKQKKYIEKFKSNLQLGINFYKTLLPHFNNIPFNTLQLNSLELLLANTGHLCEEI
jgi:hypothetical protein